MPGVPVDEVLPAVAVERLAMRREEAIRVVDVRAWMGWVR
jgi:hypothetical protein